MSDPKGQNDPVEDPNEPEVIVDKPDTPVAPLSPADMSAELKSAEINRLRAENDTLKKILTETQASLKKANDHIDSENRGKLLKELQELGCTYGVETLSSMGTDSLRALKRHYEFFDPPVPLVGADMGRGSPSKGLDSIYEVDSYEVR